MKDDAPTGSGNRLARETSPYLLQHAHNPVDWYPWSEEALELARREDRPIFLSIGYSACHWCHVMERESFEDEGIAELLNRAFVPVKVDREERPDLDEIYMKAVQALSGSGGWPMSVFLTPDLRPFFGGTYFPPEDRHGRPGFASLLRWIEELWTSDRDRVEKQGTTLANAIRDEARIDTLGDVDPNVLDLSFSALAGSYDAAWGGWSPAPKFPHSTDARLLLRHWQRTGNPHARNMVLHTVDRMSRGGMYDHLAGGFARYSTDEKWLIPHFEKMLYDNALLVPLFLEAHLVSGEERHARVARETCDWMLTEMRTPEGALASSLDADSEGVEGRCYVWTPAELTEVLGDERGAWAAAWFGVTSGGNFEEGRSALWRPDEDAEVAERLGVDLEELTRAMEEARPALLEARRQRVQPAKDDKVLAAWNGLALSALAQAAQVLGEERFLVAARSVARYLLDHMRTEDGRLHATARHGRAHLAAYLDDHAFVVQGLLDLYETDFDRAWMDQALELTDLVTEHFEDRERGGFFTTADDHEELLTRMKVPYDGALPSGSAVHVLSLLRLADWTGDQKHAKQAERAIRSVGRLVSHQPRAFGQLLMALDLLRTGPREIVLAGRPGEPAFDDMLAVVRRTFLPQRVVAHSPPGGGEPGLPLLEGKGAPEGEARAYVCRNHTCGVPAATPAELEEQLTAGS
jgi:uncharacterized protein YyaL (SSP411 family)